MFEWAASAAGAVAENRQAAGGVYEQALGIVELAGRGFRAATGLTAARDSARALQSILVEGRVACSLVEFGVSTGRRADLAYSLLGSTGVYAAYVAEMSMRRNVPWRYRAARVCSTLKGEVPPVLVADTVLELSVSTSSMELRSTAGGEAPRYGGVLKFRVEEPKPVELKEVVLVGMWETPGGLPVVVASTVGQVYLATDNGSWSLLSIDEEMSQAGLLRQISRSTIPGRGGGDDAVVDRVKGTAKIAVKTLYSKTRVQGGGAGVHISDAIRSSAQHRYGEALRGWEATFRACETRLAVTASEVRAVISGELTLDNDGQVNVRSGKQSSINIQAETGSCGSLSWEHAARESAKDAFSSAFDSSNFWTATREVTREEMWQEMGDSFKSSRSEAGTPQVLPLKVKGVGKPMYAFPSLGIIVAEPGTYIGVGSGPSLQPLSDVSYAGGSLAVARAVDHLTGSSLTSYLLGRLMSAHVVSAGATDEGFRRLLPSDTLSLKAVYGTTIISEAATLAVLHLWGVMWVGETTKYGCLVDFLERSTPVGEHTSLSIQMDCLTNMEGITFYNEAWREGAGEYEDFKRGRRYLRRANTYALLEQQSPERYHLRACEPLGGSFEARVTGFLGFCRQKHPGDERSTTV